MPKRTDFTVEETEHGIVVHLPDFTSLRMKETAEFRATMRKSEPGKVPCSHWRRGVELDEEQRSVHCQNCKSNLDPFDALMEITKEWDRIRDDFARARQEERETRTRIEVLARFENNLRARLKRLGVDKLPGDFGWPRNLRDTLKDLLLEVLREERAKAKGAAK